MIKYDKYDIILLLVIIGTIIFFLFIMPCADDYYFNEKFSDKNKENENEIVKIDTLKCSKSCCGLSQWAVPDELLNNDINKNELQNYIPSNFSCNFGNNSGGGCVCLKQTDYDYLKNHGNNK